MELTTAIQEALVTLLCYDNDNAGMVSVLTPSGLFDPHYKELAQAAIKYRDDYGKVPGEHTLDLVEKLKTNKPDEAIILDKLFDSIEETKAGVNADYVINQANKFARLQKIRSGIQEALGALKADDVDTAANQLATCIESSDKHFDSGTFLHKPQALRFLEDDAMERYPTGVPLLDHYHLGPARKTLNIMVALPNAGKSWWLCSLGKGAIKEGKKVLHITCEMSEDQVLQRYFQSCFAMSKREAEIEYYKFEGEDPDRIKIVGNMPDDAEIVHKTRRKVKNFEDHPEYAQSKQKWFKMRGKLLVKQFPSGQLSVRDLRVFLDTLEHTEKFIPDLILIDYIDIMEVKGDKKNEALSKLYVDVRGLAVERNVAIASASQANRAAENARLITGEHIAADYEKLAHADEVFTFNKTKQEEKLGFARVYVLKSRGESKGQVILLSQNYETGQFCLDNALMRDNAYRSMVKEILAEEDLEE